jgi:hypothetical protein
VTRSRFPSRTTLNELEQDSGTHKIGQDRNERSTITGWQDCSQRGPAQLGDAIRKARELHHGDGLVLRADALRDSEDRQERVAATDTGRS